MPNDDVQAGIELSVNAGEVTKGLNQIAEAMKGVEKQSGKTTQKVEKDAKAQADAEKKLAEIRAKSEARASGKATLIGKRSAANQADTQKRTEGNIAVQEAKKETEVVKIEGRKQVIELDQRLKKENYLLRKSYQERLNIIRQGEEAGRKLAELEAKKNDPWRQLNKGAAASGLRPSQELFGNINSVLGMYNARQQYMMAGATQWRTGISPSQLLQQNINSAIARGNAANSAYFASNGNPPNTPPTGGGGFFGGRGNLLTRILGAGGGGRAGQLASNVLGGLGIGVGAYAVRHMVEAAVESEKLATAYSRQTIAARNLAGGQERLNQLLDVYNKASGGAVSKTDALANTTRLLAIGQGKSIDQFEKFVRGTRGASIALGRPETDVQEQTQLAIANTSRRRLDQIGLGVEEVDHRIAKLRKNNAAWNRDMAFSEAVIQLLDEKYGSLTKTIEGQATGVERLEKAWADLHLAMGKNAKGPIDQVAGWLAGGVNWNTERLQGRDYFYQHGPNALLPKDASDTFKSGYSGAARDHAINQMAMRILGPFMGMGFNAPKDNLLQYRAQPALLPSAANGGNLNPIPEDPNAEARLDARRQAYQQIDALERSFSNQRISATQQYEEQRLSIIRNYEKSVAREEQDFVRQRARGLRDYEKQIVDIMRDGQDRDRELRSDYDKQLRELNEDSEKRRNKIEENYQEQREKAEKDHKDRMLKAAGQLDAIAVLEERKRYAEDNKERKKQHNEALKDEKEAADERRQDALDALNERLEDARKADEKRLADMEAARKQQLADEDEDRAIQKQRAAEDHDDELNELKRQHDLQMAEIERQYQAQKTALEDALMADLAAVGIYIEGYQQRLEKKDKLIEKFLDDYLEKLEKRLRGEDQAGTYEYDPLSGPKLPYQGYARGGLVKQTGRALVHAGEFVLSRQMMAAGWSPNNNYTNQRSVVFQDGAVRITTTPGYEMLVGQLVEDKLVELMESV